MLSDSVNSAAIGSATVVILGVCIYIFIWRRRRRSELLGSIAGTAHIKAAPAMNPEFDPGFPQDKERRPTLWNLNVPSSPAEAISAIENAVADDHKLYRFERYEEIEDYERVHGKLASSVVDEAYETGDVVSSENRASHVIRLDSSGNGELLVLSANSESKLNSAYEEPVRLNKGSLAEAPDGVYEAPTAVKKMAGESEAAYEAPVRAHVETPCEELETPSEELDYDFPAKSLADIKRKAAPAYTLAPEYDCQTQLQLKPPVGEAGIGFSSKQHDDSERELSIPNENPTKCVSGAHVESESSKHTTPCGNKAVHESEGTPDCTTLVEDDLSQLRIDLQSKAHPDIIEADSTSSTSSSRPDSKTFNLIPRTDSGGSYSGGYLPQAQVGDGCSDLYTCKDAQFTPPHENWNGPADLGPGSPGWLDGYGPVGDQRDSWTNENDCGN